MKSSDSCHDMSVMKFVVSLAWKILLLSFQVNYVGSFSKQNLMIVEKYET